MSKESTTLARADLAETLKNHLGVNQREAMELVAAFFDEITDALERKDHVKLARFATFSTRDKSERPGRNLRTGEEVTISARRIVTFKPSAILTKRIAKYAGPGIE